MLKEEFKIIFETGDSLLKKPNMIEPSLCCPGGTIMALELGLYHV
jgi:hypothetical protein